MAQKWWILLSVACGTFMATLDSSVVNIALPSLTQEFGANLYRIKWVVISYLLVLTCLLLPFGRLSDHYGRKTVFQLGFLVFVLGSGLCGLAPDLISLVVLRALQAIGAAMLMANGPAIITSTFPSKDRGTALGTLAMVVSLGLVTGPSMGGFLISQLGWRSIFYLNVPVGLIGLLLVQQFVRKDTPARAALKFDWVGAFLQTTILILFMILFDPPHISISGSMPLPVSRVLLGVIVIILTLLFIQVERDAVAPLFDLSLMRNRTFRISNLSSFLMFVALSSVSVLMPFFLEEGLLLPPHQAGFYMTAIPLTVFVIAPISGRLSDRFGSKGLSLAGSIIGSVGLFLMAGVFGEGIHIRMAHFYVIFFLCSIGIATGLFQSPNNNAIMGSVPINKLGVASALMATIRNLGIVTGTGLATSIFSWRLNSTGDLINSFHSAFFIAGWIGAAATFALMTRRSEANR